MVIGDTCVSLQPNDFLHLQGRVPGPKHTQQDFGHGRTFFSFFRILPPWVKSNERKNNKTGNSMLLITLIRIFHRIYNTYLL